LSTTTRTGDEDDGKDDEASFASMGVKARALAAAEAAAEEAASGDTRLYPKLQDLDLSCNRLTGPIPPLLPLHAPGVKVYIWTQHVNQNLNTARIQAIRMPVSVPPPRAPVPIAAASRQVRKKDRAKGPRCLKLHTNFLSGPLPSGLSSFLSLRELDIGNNKLTGI
jgi:hypothetical protein